MTESPGGSAQPDVQMHGVPEAMVEAARRRLGRSDIQLAVASPAEYARVAELSRSASPEEVRSPLTRDLIAWFVDENPYGHGFVVTASDPGSAQVIGYFVFHPWGLTGPAFSRPTRTFLFVRLYVAPEYRRRKVFAAMTSFGFDLLSELDVELAYTVPNPRSSAGFLRFGMQKAGDLVFWVRPNVPGWGWIGGRRQRASGVSVELRESFDRSFDGEEWRDVPFPATMWSPRTRAALNWRYVARPGERYEIRYLQAEGLVCGYLVTRRMRIKGLRTLVVCDAWVPPSHATALRTGIEDALRSGARADLAVAFGGNAVPAYRSALEGAGFVVCPRRLQPQPVAIIGRGVHRHGREAESLPTVDAWHLTPFDWDVF